MYPGLEAYCFTLHAHPCKLLCTLTHVHCRYTHAYCKYTSVGCLKSEGRAFVLYKHSTCGWLGSDAGRRGKHIRLVTQPVLPTPLHAGTGAVLYSGQLLSVMSVDKWSVMQSKYVPQVVMHPFEECESMRVYSTHAGDEGALMKDTDLWHRLLLTVQ